MKTFNKIVLLLTSFVFVFPAQQVKAQPGSFSPFIEIEGLQPIILLHDEIDNFEYKLGFSNNDFVLQRFDNATGARRNPLLSAFEAPGDALSITEHGVGVGGQPSDTSTLQVSGGPGLPYQQGKISIVDSQPDRRPIMLQLLSEGGGSKILFQDSTVFRDGRLWMLRTDDGVFEIDASLSFGTQFSLDAFGNMAVAGTDARIRVEDVNETPGLRTMFELVNNGPSRFELNNVETGQTWAFQTNNADGFLINRLGSGGNEFSIRKSGMVTMGPGGVRNFTLHPNGDLDILGTLSQLSDQNAKRDFQEVNSQEVLNKVAQLPITTWHYKDDNNDVRHMGPMAQDFRAAFGLGKDETSIASVDTTGVMMASIQALAKSNQSLQQQNAVLTEELARTNDEMSAVLDRLDSLEAMLVNQRD